MCLVSCFHFYCNIKSGHSAVANLIFSFQTCQHLVILSQSCSQIPLHLSPLIEHLLNLLSASAPIGDSSPSSSGLAKHLIARSTYDDSLHMAEDGGNLKTCRALNVHKEAIGTLHKTLELVHFGFGVR